MILSNTNFPENGCIDLAKFRATQNIEEINYSGKNPDSNGSILTGKYEDKRCWEISGNLNMDMLIIHGELGNQDKG